MILIKVPPLELYDEATNRFIYYDEDEIGIEHSLYTIASYEEATHEPYLSRTQTPDEIFPAYLPYMVMKQPKSQSSLDRLTNAEITKIKEYMNDSHTATWFNRANDEPSSSSSQTITAEIVYGWMFAYHIPMECEHWPFNRLMTLIEVCANQKAPQKTMSEKEVRDQYKRLNAKRRAEIKARKAKQK